MGETPPDSVPAPAFDVALRGYDRAQVEKFVALLLGADRDVDSLPSGSYPPKFDVALRGYDRAQVDRWIAEASGVIGQPPPETAKERIRLPGTYSVPVFGLALRGYDRAQVDWVTRRISAAVAGDDSVSAITREEAEAAAFRVVLLGYNRAQVHAWIAEALPALPE